MDDLTSLKDQLDELITALLAKARKPTWRELGKEPPPKLEIRTAGALHSRYVLVDHDGRMFTAQLWERASDGKCCWVPAYTHEKVDACAGDRWIPLEEIR